MPSGKLRKTAEEELRARTFEIVTDFGKAYFAEGKAAGEAEGEARGEARGEAKGEAKGQAKAKRESVLAVLAARGIEITPEQNQLITRSTSLASLDKWLRQAATADSADEVFA